MSSADKKTEDSPKITDQESRFFFIILLNMEGPLQVNWDTVAEQAGYNSGDVAKVNQEAARCRLGRFWPFPAKTPAKSVKRRAGGSSGRTAKRTKTVMSGNDDDVFEDGVKGSPLAKKKMKSEDGDIKAGVKDEGEDELKDEDEGEAF
ncbi:uncharacterized protein PG998_009252 [Apiospora kogelbergensis]|uniref:uncharacterized protein n=1 Tax=Apiospora kogelbergensis TaxID=1337665 RepID=UPI003130F530